MAEASFSSPPPRGTFSGVERVLIVAVAILLLAKAWPARLPLSDFKVYLRAGEALAHGEYLYDPPDTYHFYRYKYPPTAALLFLPYSCLPLPAAKVAWGATLLVCLLLIFRRLGSWGGEPGKNGPAWVCLLAFGGMLQYEFHLGQVTLPILLLLLLVGDLVVAGQPGRAGLLMAVSLHFKPFSWPLAFWGLARREWRFVLWTGLWFGVLAVTTVPFFGIGGSATAWKGFLEEMRQLQEVKVDLATPENHTLASFLVRWLHLGKFLPQGLHPGFAAVVNGLLLLFPLAAAFRRTGKPVPADRRDLAWLVAAVPLIGPSEYKYFLLGLPAAWLGVVAWRRLGLGGRALLTLGLLGVGINIYDLWGRAGARFLAEISVVTLGGFCLYLLAGWLASERTAEVGEVVGVGEAASDVVPRGGGSVRRWEAGDGVALTLAGLLFVGTLILEERSLPMRQVCRKCGEDMASGLPVCKSCGHSGLAAYAVRQSELARRRVAGRRIVGLEPAGAAVLLAREFPDLPAEDAARLLAGCPSPPVARPPTGGDREMSNP